MATAPEARPGSFLSCLSPAAVETLLSFAQSFEYKAGEVIFAGGDPSARVYIVKSGRVALSIHVPHKGAVTLMTLGPSDLFGWSAMVPPKVQTASAKAIEQAEVLAIDARALFDQCEKEPRFGFELYRAITAVMTARLRATRLQLLDVFAHP